jgi:hypothetical protein
MTRRRKLLIAGLLVLASIVGYGIYDFMVEMHLIGSEYDTCRVVDEVIRYVDSHEGRWPGDWNDLPAVAPFQARTRMRFDVDVATLMHDSVALRNAIQPLRGYYRVYPHSQLHYEDLRFALEDRGTPNKARRNVQYAQ